MPERRKWAYPTGTLAVAVARSGNRKIGNAATTYAAQASCPSSCPFLGAGCYAEELVPVRRLAAAASTGATPLDVALAEAAAIDALEVSPGRPLRLHTVGDCPTVSAARVVAAAAERYMARGGGPVWTYTHAWRDVPREAWGKVSVLASCETPDHVHEARTRGYATAVVVEGFQSDKRHKLPSVGELTVTGSASIAGEPVRSAGAAGEATVPGNTILPCPQQTRGVSCAECRLCMDDERLREAGYSIAFAVHGAGRAETEARRRLRGLPVREATRTGIPRLVAELGRDVTTRELAQRLGVNESSAWEMRQRLRREGAAV